MWNYLGIRFLSAWVGLSAIAATVYVLLNPQDIGGLELYFMLPLSYSVMALLCHDIFEYHSGGFGLKCLYIVSYIRYVVLPVYTCSVWGALTFYPPNYYRYAIVVSCLEIIVTFVVIRIYYPNTWRRCSRKKRVDAAIAVAIKEMNLESCEKTIRSRLDAIRYNSSFGIGGFVFLLILVTFVVVRGHSHDVIDGMRFFVVSTKYDDNTDSWTYDIWAIQLLFAFLTVVVTSYFQQRELKKSSLLNLILPTICAVLSCTMVLTDNRMTIVYYALCGLCILSAAFPKRTKFLSSLMITILMVVMVSFTLMKNWNIDVANQTGSSVSNREGASTLSAYVCGVDNIAHTYDMYSRNGDQFSAMNLVAEAIKFFRPSQLPEMTPESIRPVPTTVDLATTGTEMVSVAGETLYWGSPTVGWLLDILAVYIIVRLLVFFDVKTKTTDDLGTKYIYCWLAVLFGIFMCYCIQTLWYNITFMPLFLGFALLLNKHLRISSLDDQMAS